MTGHIEEIKEYCLHYCQTTDTTNSSSSSFLPSFFSLIVVRLFSLFFFLFSLLHSSSNAVHEGRISNMNNEVNHTTNNIEAVQSRAKSSTLISRHYKCGVSSGLQDAYDY
jgi:hypothetical protein